jgi:catechol 2,3-dioxygenase-like lactoylglutathione lyase family enzyme
MTILGIDHVQVAAPRGCEAEARAFYGGLLGLEELPKPQPLRTRGGCWFRAGASELHVGVEEPFTPARKAHPGFVVDDLVELTGRLRAEGIEVTPDDSIPGRERAYVADPFGNRLELRRAGIDSWGGSLAG